MTTVEFMKWKTPITININLKISDQTNHILYNINVFIILLL